MQHVPTNRWRNIQALVGDLVDNMSSISPGQEDFLVDTIWAEALSEVVNGSDEDADYAYARWLEAE